MIPDKSFNEQDVTMLMENPQSDIKLTARALAEFEELYGLSIESLN
jgi:hypothetical protein